MADWTPEEDAALHRMWAVEGLSASLCAQKLPGDRSRNSIIGRVNRNGWSRPHAAAPGTALRYPKRISAPKVERKTGRGNSAGSRESLFIGHRKAPLPVETVEIGADIASPFARPWIDRTAGQCAFPVDGEGADTRSCCNPTSHTYCAAHMALMVNPSLSRKVYPGDLGAPASKPRGARSSIFSSWLEDAA